MFHIEYDPPANCLSITVKGFWTPGDVPAFARELVSKARQARAVRSDFNVIVESFEFPVQSNDVADLLAGIMREAIPLTSGRAAVVVGSQLNKAQAERTLVHPQVQVFASIEDAWEWLDAKG